MYAETVEALLRSGAAAAGAVGRGALEPVMTRDAACRAEALMPGWTALFTAAFSYYAPEPEGGPDGAARISRYAWGTDYHAVLKRRMAPAAELLRENGAAALALADASPFPERLAASLAGIGFTGQNGFLILPPYGTCVFIGTVLTDARGLALPEPLPPRSCEGCGACAAACPTGALGRNGLDPTRCLSAISQKRGDLTGWEQSAMRRARCVWGCDACQDACPHNLSPAPSPIPEFREGLVTALTPEMFEGLSRREFARRWGDRAFAWRGGAVLLRNLKNLDSGK